MAAVREYQEATGKRVTLAWTLLAGVNTRPEDARRLAELTAGMPVRLDLIDVNDADGTIHAAVGRGAAGVPQRADGGTGDAGGAPLQRRQGRGRGVRDAGGAAAGPAE